MSDLMRFADKVSKTLLAMAIRRGDDVSLTKLHNERYQRTMTDEYNYPWLKNKPPRPGYKPLDEEQRRMWEAAAARK